MLFAKLSEIIKEKKEGPPSKIEFVKCFIVCKRAQQLYTDLKNSEGLLKVCLVVTLFS